MPWGSGDSPAPGTPFRGGGRTDFSYNEFPPERGLVDAVKGAVLALAARREVEELPEGCPAAAGITPALQGGGAVAQGQARVAAVRAGAGAEGGQPHGLLVALWVAGVTDSSAGGRLLGQQNAAAAPLEPPGCVWTQPASPQSIPAS